MKGEVEILNLEYNKRQLILKALNCMPNKRSAAIRLGISEKTLYRYEDMYEIIKCPIKKEYIAKKEMEVTLLRVAV